MVLFVHPTVYRRHRRIKSALDWLLIVLWIGLVLIALLSPEKRGMAILGLIGATLARAAVLGFVEGWLGIASGDS